VYQINGFVERAAHAKAFHSEIALFIMYSIYDFHYISND